MSTLVAQLTCGSYFSATNSSPVTRFIGVAEAITIEVRERRDRFAPLLTSAESSVDAVKSPIVVGRHLVTHLRAPCEVTRKIVMTTCCRQDAVRDPRARVPVP